MTIRAYLLSSVSLHAVRIGMPRITARDAANALSWAYGKLGLSHVNRTAP